MEREYVTHRGAVMGMLRSEFPNVPDLEELYQEAWAEALEMQARGADIVKLEGLLKTIAWRRARDRARKQRPLPMDPAGAVFAVVPDDTAPLPDEISEARLDTAVVRQVMEELEPRQVAVLKLRFDEHLDSREIQQRLGVSPKRLEKLVTEAYACVAELLELHDGEQTRWQRRQRSLLLACEAGVASPRQRERARRMVAEDPNCRAMLREMRSTLEQVSALLPLPVMADDRARRPLATVLDRIEACADTLRDQVAGLVPRASTHASSFEQAGAAGLGGSLATKVVVGCLLVGGGTVVCVESGVLRDSTDAKAPVVADKPRPRPTPKPQPKPSVPSRPAAQPKKRATAQRKSSTSSTPASSAKAAPSPAQPGSQEFGPGNLGSTSAPSTPASAPADGGGEFGP